MPQSNLPEHDDEVIICSQCNGSGEGMYDGSNCTACKGSGEQTDKANESDIWERADYFYDRYREEGF